MGSQAGGLRLLTSSRVSHFSRLLPGAVLATVLALTGCSAGSEGEDAGCGACTEEVAALRSQVTDVDGVLEVDRVSYAEKVALTTPPTLTIQVRLDDTDPDKVTEALAELAWKSRVRPIDDLAIDYLAPGQEYSTSVDHDFRDDAAEYERRWGARPTGSGG